MLRHHTARACIKRRTTRSSRRAQAGFAYLLLLISIAIIGAVASNTLSLGTTAGRRDAEQELLYIGGEFERALRSYVGRPGVGNDLQRVRGPRTLEELLKDPRFPSTRRHLRQIYTDPLTGKAEWGLVKDQAGFILAVYSLAEGTPIKRSNFPANKAHFEEADTYQQWVFGVITPRRRTPQRVDQAR